MSDTGTCKLTLTKPDKTENVVIDLDPSGHLAMGLKSALKDGGKFYMSNGYVDESTRNTLLQKGCLKYWACAFEAQANGGKKDKRFFLIHLANAKDLCGFNDEGLVFEPTTKVRAFKGDVGKMRVFGNYGDVIPIPQVEP